MGCVLPVRLRRWVIVFLCLTIGVLAMRAAHLTSGAGDSVLHRGASATGAGPAKLTRQGATYVAEKEATIGSTTTASHNGASQSPATPIGTSPAWLSDAITAKVGAMSLRHKVGQVLMVGLPSSWSPRSPGILSEAPAGAICLYKRNIRSKQQLRLLTSQVQSVIARRTDAKAFVAIDHEGGRVNRLPEAEFTMFPSNRVVGTLTNAEQFVTNEAAVMASELLSVGIHINLAPVMDVCTNPSNPDIKDRSYGADTARVCDLGTAFIRTALARGLFVVAKHFPGYGPIGRNPHQELPLVQISRASWARQHMLPFKRAIEAGVPGVMVGHVAYAALDPAGVPASISSAVVTGILRRELGFHGLVLTDDLEMGAITRTVGVAKAAVKAMKAGADILLVCHTPEAQLQVVHGLEKAIVAGELSQQRLDEAVWRVLWYKYHAGLWAPRGAAFQGGAGSYRPARASGWVRRADYRAGVNGVGRPIRVGFTYSKPPVQ